MVNIFDDDDRDQTAEQFSFKINEDYAAKYEKKKRGEELSKLQDKYGDVNPLEGEDEEEEEETEYSSEDSDAEFVTPQVDAAILRTILKIRKGDPSIYQKDGKDLFAEEERLVPAISSLKKALKSNKEKPVYLKDIQRANLISALQHPEADDDDETSRPAAILPTPAQEAAALKAEVKAAFHQAVPEDDEDEEDDLLVRRDKTDKEEVDEDEEYKRFLLNSLGGGDRAERELLEVLRVDIAGERKGREGKETPVAEENEGARDDEVDGKEGKKKKKKKDKKGKGGSERIEEADEKFLQNYILNRGWLDKDAKKIPKYSEIVGDEPLPSTSASSNKPLGAPTTGPNSIGRAVLDLEHDEEDEEFVEKAENYETKYNFRFEDPAGANITTHSRQVDASVRREDNARKRARDNAKARKEEEKQARMEELKRLKSLKRKELVEKLEKIKEITGGETELRLDDLDLEGDFDPSKHDTQMSGVFGQDFYSADDTDKPVWEDDIDINDIVPDFGKDEGDAEDDEDETAGGQVEMDADFLPGGDAYDPASIGNKKKSKRKEKNKKAKDKKGKAKQIDEDGDVELGADVTELGADEKRFMIDEEDARNWGEEERKRKFDQYIDEYYKLDYEDMIGDLPTRFHYTKVAGSSYDLSPQEILLATDAELNEYVSLRKIAPYRTDTSDGKARLRKKKLRDLRERIRGRKWGEEVPEDGPDGDRPLGAWVEKKKGQKKGKGKKKGEDEGKGKGNGESSRKRKADGADGEATGAEMPQASGKKKKRKNTDAAEYPAGELEA